jgi:glutamine---fructose-6-phosphate transaminase (isomerizing)
MHLSIIQGAYLADIRQQPDTLERLIHQLEGSEACSEVAGAWRDTGTDSFVLTGMGSSYHALYPLHRALCSAGRSSCHVETAELLHGFRGVYRGTSRLIAVSQSGESAEIVGLMRHAADFGETLAVTNQPASSLGREARRTLPIHSGAEATVSCKSYLNSLAALRWLEAVVLGGNLSAVIHELQCAERVIRGYLSAWESHVAEAARLLVGANSLFVVGRGRSLATAGAAGLTLKESTRRHAEGMSAAAFRHGPIEMIGAGSCVIVLEGEGEAATLNRRLVTDIVRAGGRAAGVSPEAPESFLRLPLVPEPVRPLVEMLPLQMVSLALAALDGREAGRFERASKITTVA